MLSVALLQWKQLALFPYECGCQALVIYTNIECSGTLTRRRLVTRFMIIMAIYSLLHAKLQTTH